MSTVLSLIFLGVGIIIGIFIAPNIMDVEKPAFIEILKLCMGGWIGFLGIGSVLNFLALITSLVTNRN